MLRVAIPRTCPRRQDLTYARLLLRVYPLRTMANAFEGVLLKPGAMVDESALWPSPEYPEIPILLEYAGSDRTGRGHNRSNDVYLLWRYDRARGAWVEIARSVSRGAEWIERIKAVALLELGLPVLPADPADTASAAGITDRVLGLLDRELERLCPQDRHLVMNFVYQEFSARAAAY